MYKGMLSCRNRWDEYETRKEEIKKRKLTADEYEKAIRKLAKDIKV